jgi:hypothetical protein
MSKVCFECQERHEACWGSCPKYLAAKAEHEKQKKMKHDEKVITSVQYHAHRVYLERQARREKQKGL